MKKVSIIIPVYNAENYLKKCIDSVINQSYKNYEIILVNDGSKDNSLKICKDYEKKYSKIIKVIDQKNSGAAIARNNAIKCATGDYIVFLDSDDWITDDYIMTFISNIKDNDILISGFKRYNNKYEFEYEKKPENNEWAKFKYCSVAGKMFKKSFIIKNNIEYNKYKIGEDACFNIKLYSLTNKIKVLDYAGYCNYENIHSVTNKSEEIKTFRYVLDDINKFLLKQEKQYINDKTINFYYLKALILDIFLNREMLKTNDLLKLYNDNYSWFKNTLKQKDNRLSFYFQEGEDFKIIFLINLFILFSTFHIQIVLILIIKLFNFKII